MTAVAEFKTGYLDQAFTNVDEVIRNAKINLRRAKVDYDTLVGTGFSGGLIVPMLARELDKNFVLIRKPRDNSHHSGQMVGLLGERWIFVDDFVSSGRTRNRVQRIIKKQAADKFHETTYVGSYCYGASWGQPPGSFQAAW
jgi:adenine/guanine phosphoribosyltransferase-like PRPP-binding protein